MSSPAGRKEETVVVGASTLRLLGTIHGLKREGQRVRAAFEEFGPDCLAVGIPREDVETLGACSAEKSGDVEFETSEEQDYFFDCLATFGEVRVPPPDLVAAYLLSREKGVPLEALDMDDDRYAQVFTDHVSLLGLLRVSRKNRRVQKRGLAADSPEAFVLEWDSKVNATKQFRAVEAERERHMAHRLFELAQRYPRILALLPYPRYDGVLSHLGALKKHKK
ncbi:MAG: hypothetical protein PHU95_01125 [Candidatus Thermoplasmatota archaeon]|nr:hypothetical protein [Candidatus Thermoplasmatota archaeon]MDD5778039.1 hypothetical protein [Candidatus Thermoplasmatota archaeon]